MLSFIFCSSLCLRSLIRRRATKNVVKAARRATAATPPTTPPATVPLVEEETVDVVLLDDTEVASALLEGDIVTVDKVDIVPVARGGTTTPMLLIAAE